MFGGNSSKSTRCVGSRMHLCMLIDLLGTDTFVCPLNTGICTKTCGLDNMFPPDDICFGLDTNTNHMVKQDMYLNV